LANPKNDGKVVFRQHHKTLPSPENIFDEGELKEEATCKDFLQVQNEGSRKIERKQKFYNLDAIISVGYRIKSHIATKFRIWATERLKEYIIKGFTMDDERLKQVGGGGYWYELLNRIRDIRSSEKVLYRQVLDLYATSVDYDPNTPESVEFLKLYKTNCIMLLMGIPQPKLFTSVPIATNRLWV